MRRAFWQRSYPRWRCIPEYSPDRSEGRKREEKQAFAWRTLQAMDNTSNHNGMSMSQHVGYHYSVFIRDTKCSLRASLEGRFR
jgi:hypothetical protein